MASVKYPDLTLIFTLGDIKRIEIEPQVMIKVNLTNYFVEGPELQ